MPELRPYQVEMLERVAAAERRGIRRQLVVASTGLGKTCFFVSLARQRAGRTLILAHRDELIEQAVGKVLEWWPDAPVGVVKAERNEVRAQVVVASVQTLARPKRMEQLLAATEPSVLLGAADPFDLLVTDEAHHGMADSYAAIYDRLGVGTEQGPLHVGVTATPDRGDGKGLDGQFDEIVACFDILWGIRSGYLADLRGLRVTLDQLDLSGVKVRRGDYEAGAAGRALEDAGAPDAVVAAWHAHAQGRRTLVFTPTVDLARLTCEAFQHAGVAAGFVHGGTPLPERRQLLADYSAGRIQVMANCAVLTEGYDEPRTDCIIVARPTRSRALYCFDAATEVLTPEGWVPGRSVAEGATIAAFDPTDGSVRWEPVLAHVERPLLPGERMMALRSPSIDLRVTDTHRMVWRRRHGKARTRGPWEVSLAGELAERRDVWELPVAGMEKAEGVPLTTAELAFIGWVQTDGCVNHKTGAVQISQQYPEQRRHIEATLDACGFKWRVTERNDATPYGPRRYPLAVYRISRGKPRGTDKHLRGWGVLAPWLPKADPAAWGRLEAMDADQLAVLLDAWHRGDGSKQAGQSWTRRGYHLSIADQWVAGWLQGMCMRRGWRANVVRQASLWMLHCRQGVARYVGGARSTDRPRLHPDAEQPGERVWCVSVPSGAILTRRNGKGAIVGQTQMIGRGTRRHPDKADCLVLDVVGASAEHSLVTIPSLFGIDQSGLPARMGDGTGLLTDVLDQQDRELVRLGRLRAEEAELFGRVRQAGIAWVPVHDDGALRMYVRPLGTDADGRRLPVVVLAQRDPVEDRWTAGLQDADGTKRVLLADVAMELAQGVAEDYVRRHGGGGRLHDQQAPWRKRKPSAKQLHAAGRWKLPQPEQYKTAGELSEALDRHIARIQARRRKEKRAAVVADVAAGGSFTADPYG